METAKRCAVCGKTLPPRRSKYCSDNCARLGANALARAVTSQREHPAPFRTIRCPDCGVEVTVPIKSIRCPACQREANRRHERECKARRRAGRAREIGSIDLCRRCGQPYTVASGTQKYCPVCAPIAVAETDRAASRAWNKAHYATPEKRAELREGKRRPKPDPVACAICGSIFQPVSARGVYCSAQCAAAAGKAQLAAYEAAHRAEISARKKQQAQQRLAAMTPEDLAAHREKINAQARENYRRRKENAKQRGEPDGD